MERVKGRVRGMESSTQSGKAPIRPTCVLATIPVSQAHQRNTIHPHVTSHVTVSALPTMSAVCFGCSV